MVKYPVSQPYFPPGEIESILSQFKDILNGKAPLSMGPRVKEFEQTFAHYCDAPYAVAVNSCSAALEIALQILALKPGDEVIVPAETFIATGATVVRQRGKVVFAEIDPETFCLSAQDVERRISDRTRAVIIVHMAGLITPDILAIQKLCEKRNLVLIEDAAHAPGAMLHGKKAGNFGQMACFSFYPTKVMTTAEGGMLVTQKQNYFEEADSLRNRGRDMKAAPELYFRAGTNHRMTEFAAILGLSQLKYLDRFIEHRNKIASFYTESLSDLNALGIAVPLPCPATVRHSYWRYLVKIGHQVDRNLLKAKMDSKGIAIDWAYDPPLHLQPLFRSLDGNQEGMLPVTEQALKQFVSLPVYANLTIEEASFIINTFKKCVRE